jgi:putative ABC transport system permease protein
MAGLLSDLRLAARGLRATPWTTAMAVLTLALGTGLTTAMYAAAYGILVRPMPYLEPSRVALLWTRVAGIDRDLRAPRLEVDEWRRRLSAFDDVSGFTSGSFTLRGAGEDRVVEIGLVTERFFDALGTRPTIGRTIQSDRGLDQVVVSDRLRRRIEALGSPIVGHHLDIGGRAFVVTGALPPGFALPSDEVEAWVQVDAVPGVTLLNGANARMLQLIARLPPGVTFDQARDDLQRVAAEMFGRDQRTGRPWRDAALAPLDEQQVGPVRPVLAAFGAAAALVLIIACANVATLLATRTMARDRELAVRLALGASRGHLVVAVLGETLLVVLLGSAAGVWVAALAVGALAVLPAGLVPRSGDVHIDGTALAASAVVALVAAAVAGLIPMLRAFRSDGGALMGRRTVSGGRTDRRLRAALAAVQVALSVVLLVGAGLVTRTVLQLLRADTGTDARGVVTMRLMLTGSARFDAGASGPFVRDLLREVRALPGVEHAGLGGSLPPDTGALPLAVRFTDERGERDDVLNLTVTPVTPGYLSALGVRFLGGRDFDEEDSGRSATILSATAARLYFPSGSPVGRDLPPSLPPALSHERSARVVGLVDNVKYNGLDAPTGAALYLPWDNLPSGIVYLVVRTAGRPLQIVPAIRRVARALDPRVAIADVRTLDDVIAGSIAQRSLREHLAQAFAGLALLVTLTGLAAVVGRTVVERRRELAIRLAVGASPNRVVGDVLREGSATIAAGVGAGLLVSALASRGLAHLLYGVSPHDPVSFGAAALTVAALALVAAWLPARRAMEVNPAELMREE